MRSDVIGDVSWEPLLIHCGVMTFKYDSACRSPKNRRPIASPLNAAHLNLQKSIYIIAHRR
jgi:hypothetical protein